MLSERSQIHVILDNVRSAQNVGSIFRTADAAGVTHIHLTGLTCWPPHPKLEKTSLGAHEHVAWSHYETAEEAVDWLVQQGIPVVAVEKTSSSICLGDYGWPPKVALVLGHEVVGVSEAVLKRCLAHVAIPMHGFKNSLNVATAFGIVVYDILGQAKRAQHQPLV